MEIDKYVRIGCITAINNIKKNTIDFDNEYIVKIQDDYKNVTVKKYLITKCGDLEERIVNGLKLVNLAETILNKKISNLSSSELLKIELDILLIKNVPCLMFYNFDKYFMEKDLAFFKKLFKKLSTKYHKTIILINNDLTFLFDLIDRIVIFEGKRKNMIIDNPSFYDERILKFVEVPKIIELVNYLNQNGKKIKEYTDIKELIKAIYREV